MEATTYPVVTTARLFIADAFEDGHAVAYCAPEFDTAYRCTYGPSDGIITRVRRQVAEADGTAAAARNAGLFPRRPALG